MRFLGNYKKNKLYHLHLSNKLVSFSKRAFSAKELTAADNAVLLILKTSIIAHGNKESALLYTHHGIKHISVLQCIQNCTTIYNAQRACHMIVNLSKFINIYYPSENMSGISNYYANGILRNALMGKKSPSQRILSVNRTPANRSYL